MKLREFRWELSLLLAIAALGTLHAVLPPADPSLSPREASGWKAREQMIREEIQRVTHLPAEELQQRMAARPHLARRFRWASWGGLLLFFGFLFTLACLILRWLARRPLYTPLGSPPNPAWGGRIILQLALGAYLLMQAAVLLEWAAVRFLNAVWINRSVIAVADTLLLDGVILAVGWRILRRAAPAPSGAKGWPSVRFALGAYLVFLPVLAAVVMTIGWILRIIQYEPAPQAVFTIFLSEGRLPVIGFLGVLVSVVGPLAEEIFFRGLLYGWLRRRMGILPGLIFSSMLFAGLHGDVVFFAPVFCLGLLFGWVYEKSGSLAAPVAVHILHNSGMMVLAFMLRTLIQLG